MTTNSQKQYSICFVSFYAYHFFDPSSYSRFGGAEFQLYLLAKNLAADPKFKVSFIVGDFGQKSYYIKENIGVYKFFAPGKGLKYLRSLAGIIRLWYLLYKINPSVCIQRAAGLETGLVAVFCLLTGRKFIYMTASDADLKKKKADWMPGVMGSLRWRLYRIGLKTASLILVQHEGQLKELKQNFKKEGILRLSAHLISDVPANKKAFILWVGKADKNKQPEIFLQAARQFPGEKFVIVCPESNDAQLFMRIKNEASKFENIEFKEYIPIDEIDLYFLNAKIFVNTSKIEGFPNTFIQAAKTKTPIISLIIDPNGILEKYEMGICAESDFDKLKDALQRLLFDENLRTRMGENGFKYAKNNHDINKIIEKDKELIIKLIQKRP